MAEVVHSRVKEIGTVCSVRYPLPKEELQQNGKNLVKKMEAKACLHTLTKFISYIYQLQGFYFVNDVKIWVHCQIFLQSCVIYAYEIVSAQNG